MPNRRHFLAGAAGALAAAVVPAGPRPVFGQPLGSPPIPLSNATFRLELAAAERPTALPCFGGNTLPLWTFADAWQPVFRIPFGARLETTLVNALPRVGEQVSIHWHGIRLPNDQDGVPYLVQDPVFPGGRHLYSFTPPDPGTFFFHTHCNTTEHIGRGLLGVLIIEGDLTEPYDADEVLVLRDWRLDDGRAAFLPFTTNRGAGRAGTYGTVRTVNGAVDPVITLPAGADCRLRLLNVDPARIIEVGIEGADAAIVAIDGLATLPTALDRWQLGPAMRIDIVIRSPAHGGIARLIDHRADPPLQLATVRGTGPTLRTRPFAPAPLRAPAVPAPDLTAAETVTFVFDAARNAESLPPIASAGLLLGPTCLSSNGFWTINAAGWPGPGHELIPLPLAALQLGRTHRFVLRNRTQFLHPIHIHGYSFQVLGSDRRTLPMHHADTFLLLPEETVEVAFVADNPGKWMIHCHVTEHQETGMMGYFTVG